MEVLDLLVYTQWALQRGRACEGAEIKHLMRQDSPQIAASTGPRL